MVKHVYYKKASDRQCLAFIVEKMEKQTQLMIRRARDKKRKEQIRKDQLMIDYIKVKYPVKYEEARDYYNTLNTIYPTTHDLRKTWRFKEFQTNTKSCDNMVLKISLMNPEPNGAKETLNDEAKGTLNDEAKETLNDEAKDTINHEAKEMLNHEAKETINVETIDDIFPDIDPATLVPELPPQFIEQIINELRADPDLAALMNDVEDQMAYEEYVADDLDIDIQDNLLEKELFW